jgi:hypothetical protein
MKVTSDKLVSGFATTAKVIEEISFQSTGGNLLRIRSTADLQRSVGEAFPSTDAARSFILWHGFSRRSMAVYVWRFNALVN